MGTRYSLDRRVRCLVRGHSFLCYTSSVAASFCSCTQSRLAGLCHHCIIATSSSSFTGELSKAGYREDHQLSFIRPKVHDIKAALEEATMRVKAAMDTSVKADAVVGPLQKKVR